MLEESLTGFLGSQGKIELAPRIQQIEDWIRQQLLLSFAADGTGASTPLERMGEGWQCMVRLAALEVLSKLPDQARDNVVLLLEEPETHLHPHLRRRLRKVLERLAAQGWTVIATTHAPEFINLTENQRIGKIRRSEDGVSLALTDPHEKPPGLKTQAKLDERDNGEIFFADKVILCEGPDDQFALQHILQILGADLDAGSVSLIQVGSRNNLPDYAALLQSLATPWCAVLDEDRLPDGSLKQGAAKTLTKLCDLKSQADLIEKWNIDLEHCLGIRPDGPMRKAIPSWQSEVIQPLKLSELQQKYPDYVTVGEAVAEWVTSPSGKQ